MLIYHQCGHNFVWNIRSLQDDGAGEGLIVSPVNIEANKISQRIPTGILESSWIDPQFYLPNDSKGKLKTYPFFPVNVLNNFSTGGLGNEAVEIARECLRFQDELNFRYLVVPTRYFGDLPESYLTQLTELFVEPFRQARIDLNLNKPMLLTVIAKQLHLEAGPSRDDLLSWATGFGDVDGIYLVLDSDSRSKQIKDPVFLAGALRFIRALRLNDMEVHVGYCGIEGLLYSIANPTSVTVGSYENLRSFDPLRLETQESGARRRPPRPRVYSGRLLQWVEDVYVGPIRQLMPNWEALFDDSPYKSYLLDPSTVLNFQRSEIYKHYFFIFSQQIAGLPQLAGRAEHVRAHVLSARHLFDEIESANVVLDADSDGSHLTSWLNALAMFEAQPE